MHSRLLWLHSYLVFFPTDTNSNGSCEPGSYKCAGLFHYCIAGWLHCDGYNNCGSTDSDETNDCQEIVNGRLTHWLLGDLKKVMVGQSCLHYTLRGINYTFEGWITHYTSRVVDYTFRYTKTTHFIFIEFIILVSKLVTKQRMVTNF